MKRRASINDAAEQNDDINISPLIDMVFILLIFFIVTTVFVEETGVEVNKPQAASAVDLEKKSIMIAITDQGAVFYGGRDIGISGVRSTVRRELQKEEAPVILQVDREVRTDLLVRVYDEAKLAGAELINISTD